MKKEIQIIDPEITRTIVPKPRKQDLLIATARAMVEKRKQEVSEYSHIVQEQYDKLEADVRRILRIRPAWKVTFGWHCSKSVTVTIDLPPILADDLKQIQACAENSPRPLIYKQVIKELSEALKQDSGAVIALLADKEICARLADAGEILIRQQNGAKQLTCPV